MLDTIFKNGAGRKQASDDLRDLVTQARDEREALGAMLAKMKGEGLLHKCETLATLVGSYDERAKGFQQLQANMSSLLGQVAEAKQASQALTAPDGALASCRQAVDELNARAREAQATVAALRDESAKFDQQRAQWRQATAEVAQSAGAVAALKGELESLRRSEASLNQEMQGIRDGAREARDHSAAATEAVQDVQQKLQSFSRLQELSETTDQRLDALNALAEHVSHKVKALETQKATVERAVVEATRLNEMVWAMDAQIARLTQGREQVQQAEQAVARMEEVAQATAQELAAAGAAREEFLRESSTLESRS